jgi:hypothetical protein
MPGAALSGETIHLVWGDFRDGVSVPEVEIYYKRSDDGGSTWTDDRRMTWNHLPKGIPCIAAEGPNVLIVWMDARDDNWEIYFARSRDGGITWSPDTRLTENAGVSEVPVVEIVGDIVHVAWAESALPVGQPGTVDGYEERYIRSTDGGTTWSDVMVLTDAPKSSLDPSLVAVGDTVHLAWPDRRDSDAEDPRTLDREVYYKISTDNGLTWADDLRLTFDPAQSTIPSVAASPSAVHLMWVDEMEGTPQVLYRRNSLLPSGGPRPPDALAQNYPNPFRAGTRIIYEVKGPADSEMEVRMAIYDIRGRFIRTLLDGRMPPGKYEVYWDGRDERGASLTAGAYLYRMSTGGSSWSRRMVVRR